MLGPAGRSAIRSSGGAAAATGRALLRHQRRSSPRAASDRCTCGERYATLGADPDEPRVMSDERIAQLRRFLAERRGTTLAQPGREVPQAVPVGSTGMVLAIAEGSSGGFGARMWPSAKTMVDHIAQQAWPHDLRGKRVLELGCGVGMAGLAAGAVGAKVLLTDRDAAVLERAEANLHLNQSLIKREGGTATVSPLKWGATSAMQRLLAEHGPFDYILGSDLLYSRASYGDLLKTISYFSEPHVSFTPSPSSNIPAGQHSYSSRNRPLTDGLSRNGWRHLSDADLAGVSTA